MRGTITLRFLMIVFFMYGLAFCSLGQPSIFAPGSYVMIKPGDSEKDIIRKAASVVPSKRQLRWQELSG